MREPKVQMVTQKREFSKIDDRNQPLGMMLVRSYYMVSASLFTLCMKRLASDPVGRAHDLLTLRPPNPDAPQRKKKYYGNGLFLLAYKTHLSIKAE